MRRAALADGNRAIKYIDLLYHVQKFSKSKAGADNSAWDPYQLVPSLPCSIRGHMRAMNWGRKAHIGDRIQQTYKKNT